MGYLLPTLCPWGTSFRTDGAPVVSEKHHMALENRYNALSCSRDGFAIMYMLLSHINSCWNISCLLKPQICILEGGRGMSQVSTLQGSFCARYTCCIVRSSIIYILCKPLEDIVQITNIFPLTFPHSSLSLLSNYPLSPEKRFPHTCLSPSSDRKALW